jgi:hypothetical protein
MKIIIELDDTGTKQPEIKKESGVVYEQPEVSLAAFVSASPIDAGAPRIPDGYGIQSEGSATASQTMQGSMPYYAAGALDAGAAKIQEEPSLMTSPEMNPAGSFDQGNAFSTGPFVNIDTHHN